MEPRKAKSMPKNTEDDYVICPSCPEETLLYPAIVGGRKATHYGQCHVKCFKPHPRDKDVWYFYEPGSWLFPFSLVISTSLTI
ncbi:hypothetical protein CONPUDRAFT_86012 [Coniophora puteana RWD-64-598 SS2]|uniref:Uncharacterized protein n=1 Tax=Coniophora puteana (strain RWD-64-598) TaxID=741705 RepID=R7SEG0_CONPW|nr:uncharacterized protein CONPUDRAFT_86012 [Coniophora puteana RWD-64-598 SS2]EIW74132.1 hypothetical protein CONPUDRAFT_86012 [Coniophora puteana RWD-64-598 SS2]